ncbi:MAG: DNA-binding protein [Erysipelotrichaceae bacterium]|nr:DNA-binding protein [Erysipelotrichaceae bacterium]
MIHAFRLTRGQDLRKEIERYCEDHKIEAAVVLSSVGCLSRLKVRLAGGTEYKEYEQDFEIISVNGTLSKDGPHLHISVSGLKDDKGNELVIGGHLSEGCIVNTTAEIVLMELEDYSFSREYDKATGYKELVIKRK